MALSPMMTQYLATKEKYKDCLLFYRLGDFYEMFFEDAITASKALDLTLTGRDCGLEERAPMCGVPYHAVDGYIARLIDAGFKVAICEQLTTPEQSKGGMLERDVVRVITAGTVIEPEMLREDANNYIVSVFRDTKGTGIAYADISTGDFYVTELGVSKSGDKELEDYLIKLSPSEILCNAAMHEISKALPSVQYSILPKFSVYYDWAYSYETAYKSVTQKLGVKNLRAFSCEGKRLAVSAAGALMEYLNETQKRTLSHINRLKFVSYGSCMNLDAETFRNLELTKTMRDGKKYGSLLWLLDNTKTSMGSRFLLGAIERPLTDLNEIHDRLDAVGELADNLIVRENLSNALSKIRDIERLSAKLSFGSINPRDLFSLQESLNVLPNIKQALSECNSCLLLKLENDIVLAEDEARLLGLAIVDNPPPVTRDGGFIREGYSKELDEIKSRSQNSKGWLAEYEALEKSQTGIKNLKVGYNRVFGYYIEVPKSASDLVPMTYTRKQTVANAERYITEQLKKLESDISGADEQAVKLEQVLFAKLTDTLKLRIKDFQQTAKAIGCVDMLYSFAILAIKHNYCKPDVKDYGAKTVLIEGRHPVVESFVKNERFVSNDTFFDENQHTLIITGPNMAGKSTYMRQVALIVLMAHIGSFVPCKRAEIALTDRIFTRVGASDNLLFDQSTFMVEMTEVAGILNNATENSLIILDEVGRGTSTFDGLSIAWAVMEYVSREIRAKTLFATHYHELTELEGSLDGIKNYHIAVKELAGGIVFLRKILPGGTNKSFGIEVAALAGLPKSVVAKAKRILKQLEEADINNPRNQSAQLRLDLDAPDTRAQDADGNSAAKAKTAKVAQAIMQADLNSITPIEALKLLAELQGEIAENAQ